MASSKAALSWYGAPYDPDEIDEQQVAKQPNTAPRQRDN
jgi:hypothetical protein